MCEYSFKPSGMPNVKAAIDSAMKNAWFQEGALFYLAGKINSGKRLANQSCCFFFFATAANWHVKTFEQHFGEQSSLKDNCKGVWGGVLWVAKLDFYIQRGNIKSWKFCYFTAQLAQWGITASVLCSLTWTGTELTNKILMFGKLRCQYTWDFCVGWKIVSWICALR